MQFNNGFFGEVIKALTFSLFNYDESASSISPLPPVSMLTEDGFDMLAENGDFMTTE